MWLNLLQRVTEKQNRVNIADRMWARLLSSTNQPAFIEADERNKESKISTNGSAQNTNGAIPKADILPKAASSVNEGK